MQIRDANLDFNLHAPGGQVVSTYVHHASHAFKSIDRFGIDSASAQCGVHHAWSGRKLVGFT